MDLNNGNIPGTYEYPEAFRDVVGDRVVYLVVNGESYIDRYIPGVKYGSADVSVTVRFITTPSTQAELKAATYRVNTKTLLHKTE